MEKQRLKCITRNNAIDKRRETNTAFWDQIQKQLGKNLKRLLLATEWW